MEESFIDHDRAIFFNQHLSQNPLPIKTQVLMEIRFPLIVVESARDKATIIHVVNIDDFLILITGQGEDIPIHSHINLGETFAFSKGYGQKRSIGKDSPTRPFHILKLEWAHGQLRWDTLDPIKNGDHICL